MVLLGVNFLLPVFYKMIFEKYVDKKTVSYILKNKVTEY